MTATILLALAASIPLAAIGWAAGVLAEKLGAGLRLRGAFWALAFMVPILLAPAALVVKATGVTSPIALPAAAPAALSVFNEPAPVVAAEAPPVPAKTAARPAITLPSLPVLLTGLLILGALLRGGVLAWRLVRLHRAALEAQPLALPDGLPVRIGGAHGPLLAGWLKPQILLPAHMANLPAWRLDHIRAHEAAHARRGDQWRTLAEEVTLAAFWFNPPLAAVRARLAAAREETCDQMVLDRAAPAARRAYAESLVEALRAASVQPAAAFTGFRRAQAVRRLRAILHPGRTRWAARLAAPVLALGLLSSAGAVSLAFAAQAPAVHAVLAAPAAAVKAAFAPAPIEPQRPAARTPVVRLEYRLVTGAQALFSEVIASPREDEISFTRLSGLTSTYDGRRVSLDAPLGEVLAGFSRNELSQREVAGQTVASGGEAVLDDLTLYGRPDRKVLSARLPDGRIVATTDINRLAESDIKLRETMAVQMSRMMQTVDQARTRVSIRPTVTGGGIRLALDVRNRQPGAEEMRIVRDETSLRAVPTGEREPDVEHHRAGVVTLAPGEVAAIRWSETGRGTTGVILLIRAVADQGGPVAVTGPAVHPVAAGVQSARYQVRAMLYDVPEDRFPNPRSMEDLTLAEAAMAMSSYGDDFKPITGQLRLSATAGELIRIQTGAEVPIPGGRTGDVKLQFVHVGVAARLRINPDGMSQLNVEQSRLPELVKVTPDSSIFPALRITRSETSISPSRLTGKLMLLRGPVTEGRAVLVLLSVVPDMPTA